MDCEIEWQGQDRDSRRSEREAWNSRTTNGTSETNSEGSVKIEVFAGDYLIKINDNLKKASFTIHITEMEDISILLTAPTFATSTVILKTVSATTLTRTSRTEISTIASSTSTTTTQEALTTAPSAQEAIAIQPSSLIVVGGIVAVIFAVVVAALFRKKRSAT